jgi:riboflavin kinase/FMN adenylyltransferase
MRIYFDREPEVKGRYAYAVGAFDGIHRGHKFILQELKKLKEKNCIPSILSFFPHPDSILKKNTSFLFPIEERIRQMEREGIETAVFLKFDREIAEMDAEEFVKTILKNKLDAEWVIVGKNFTFGKRGEGDSELLIKMCSKYGINAKVVELFSCDGNPVSSSLIREELKKGSVERAGELLGYNYYIRGRVIKGDGLGRKIGFPTANIYSFWKPIIPDGVYATFCEVEGKTGKFAGALSIGPRPTFNKIERVIEVYILDFKDEIYARKIKIEFLKRIRGIKKFGNAKELVNQIERDVSEVRKIAMSLNFD